MKVTLYKFNYKKVSYYLTEFEKFRNTFFIYGIGHVKPSKVETLEVDLPDTKDNYLDIAQTALIYGKAVTKRFLITQNADIWQDAQYIKATWLCSKMSEGGFSISSDELKLIPIDGLLARFGCVSVNVVALDNYLMNKFPQYREKDISTKEILFAEFRTEFAEFVSYLVG